MNGPVQLAWDPWQKKHVALKILVAKYRSSLQDLAQIGAVMVMDFAHFRSFTVRGHHQYLSSDRSLGLHYQHRSAVRLPLRMAKRIAVQLAQVVVVLHKLVIVHGGMIRLRRTSVLPVTFCSIYPKMVS